MGCSHSKKENVPYVPPISYKELLADFGNDDKFVGMVIDEGVKGFGEGIEEMTNALEGKNRNMLKLTSHSIKGSAASIMCMPMSEMAKEIEVIIDGNEYPNIWSDIKNITDRMRVELIRITNYQY